MRDVDGNVFIDFLTGAGVLSLGHNHPELVAAAAEQLGGFMHGLDLPTPAKDAFTDAQLSMLPGRDARPHEDPVLRPDRRQRRRRRDQAVQDRDRPRRRRLLPGRVPRHAPTPAMALTGVVAQQAPVANGVPGVHFFPFSYCASCPLALRRDTCATNCIGFLETPCATRTAASRCRRR